MPHPIKTAAAFALIAAALGLGCSTPGPAHAYVWTSERSGLIADLDPTEGAEHALVPSFVQPWERVLGLAYDPYTDHLFLRLAPGDQVRVVDRPARAIKREFVAPRLPPGGDLAIRSRDRNMFFTLADEPGLVRTTLDGKFVHRIVLEGLTTPVHGVAHDRVRDELLVLPEAAGTRLLRFTLDGVKRSEITLAEPVLGRSLGHDSDARTTFAPLASRPGVGVFDESGALLRVLPLGDPKTENLVFIDLGPRSLLRLF